MNRYSSTRIKRKENGDRVYSYTLYPKIPIKNSDIFITPTYGTRLDVLANEYYGDTIFMVDNCTSKRNKRFYSTLHRKL